MAVYQEKEVASLALASLKPTGWLQRELQLQMEGITLHLDEHWGSVGKYSDWLGGSDNSWERPPYWLDGLVPLAYLLESEEGISKAKTWMEYCLGTQRENGDFGPTYRKSGFDDTLFWPKFVMLKALISYYEAKPEERILTFMKKYFAFCDTLLDTYQMDGWAQARAGDFAYCIYWLYDLTKDEALLALGKKVNAQALDWTGFLENLPITHPTKYYYDWKLMDENVSRWHLYDAMKYHATHIVNVAMGLKQPLMEYKATKDKKYLDAIYTGMKSLAKHHGQVSGIYSGDEHLSGVKPTQGSELCSVVELMFSLTQIYEMSKDTRFMDLLERITYNALPATISEDFRAHQYDQQANQVKVSAEKRNWYNNGDRANIFGFEPNFGCCLANMHQGWPKFVKNAIFQQKDSVYLGAYMPITAAVSINGTDVSIEEVTDYPFKDTIQFNLHTEQPVKAVLYFRIPAWCEAPQLYKNGQLLSLSLQDGYLKLDDVICDGDCICLQLPMEIVYNTNWYHNGLSIERGPLLYALNIKERWEQLSYGHAVYPDYAILPESDWNYAIDVKEAIRVEVSEDLHTQPFSKEFAPIRLYAKAVQLQDWGMEQNSAQDLPVSPVKVKEPLQTVELVPYACTKLRIALFPWK